MMELLIGLGSFAIILAWFAFLAWVGWRDEPARTSRYEKGHGVVPSAMQNDMMDRG